MTAPSAEMRKAQALRSAARAAGYCGLVHPDGGASCTRPPHADRQHVDYYNGRPTLASASGTRWTE
ncbi:hypothetical protein [Streptomyces pseudovenezuelae]|uniref:hypothetical protein n=1 Tax=Streptomyces pseudovenezuelae TaxID=67350 RepID=UPI0036E432F3